MPGINAYSGMIGGAVLGAALGGYRARQEGNSMLGGALLGGGMGAAAGRYAGAGINAAQVNNARYSAMTAKGMKDFSRRGSAISFGRGAVGQMKGDLHRLMRSGKGAFRNSNKRNTTLAGNGAQNPIPTPVPAMPVSEIPSAPYVAPRTSEVQAKLDNLMRMQKTRADNNFDDFGLGFFDFIDKQVSVAADIRKRAILSNLARSKAARSRSQFAGHDLRTVGSDEAAMFANALGI